MNTLYYWYYTILLFSGKRETHCVLSTHDDRSKNILTIVLHCGLNYMISVGIVKQMTGVDNYENSNPDEELTILSRTECNTERICSYTLRNSIYSKCGESHPDTSYDKIYFYVVYKCVHSGYFDISFYIIFRLIHQWSMSYIYYLMFPLHYFFFIFARIWTKFGMKSVIRAVSYLHYQCHNHSIIV